MTKKEIYRIFCESEPTLPIFSQAWWLDATAGEDNWDVCLVEKNSEVLASMPYVIKKRYGFTILSHPMLTQNLGPWLKTTSVKYSKSLSEQKKLMSKLIEQLPKYSHMQQNWYHAQTNWLPFYWRKFNSSLRYTYILNIENLDIVFQQIDSSYRNKIKKAEKLVKVFEGMSPEDFYKINKKTFLRQGINLPYSKSFFLNHHLAITKNLSGKIFYAKDSENNIHSALFLIWDKMSSYVHMVGEDPEFRNSGAGILLIWKAINFTKESLGLNNFDFEGSMIEGVEQVRRDYGAIQTPYLQVSHTPSKIIKIYRCLQEIIAK